MIHDGDYYSIFDKDKILSLLDEIEQKIIWMCHRNFIWHNIIISRYLGQDTDTPMYMEVLAGREYFPCDDLRRVTGRFYISSSYGLHKVEYWWCCKLSIYDPWWDYDRNVDTDEILLLMAKWDAENFMDISSIFHMRESYVLKYQSHDPDTLT